MRELLATAAVESSPAEAKLLLAEAELRLGEARSAGNRLRPIADSLERSGDRAALGRAMNLLGAALFELGELDDAESAFGRALQVASQDDDAVLIARATNNLGAIANVRGQRESALALYQIAVPAYQRIGNTLGLAQSFHNMAISLRDMRRLTEADEYERRALEFSRQAGDKRVQAMARVGRAELSLMGGDPQMAHAGARLAADDYTEIHDVAGIADANRLAGVALAAMDSTVEALESLNRAVALARESATALVEAESLEGRSKLLARMGERSQAFEDAVLAQAIYKRLGATEELAAIEELVRQLEQGR